MLHTLSDLDHYSLKAVDGTLGVVTGFYCDCDHWRIEFLIVELGTWASSNKVLISPSHITHIDRENKTFTLSLSVLQVQNAAPEKTQQLISAEEKNEALIRYSYPSEWSDTEIDATSYLNSLQEIIDAQKKIPDQKVYAKLKLVQEDESHLRSCESLINYRIQATDGAQGYLDEMLIDEKTWAVGFLIVSTDRWWQKNHQVLITPEQVKYVSWVQPQIYIHLTKHQLINSPQFDASAPKSREKELNLPLHYDRNGYQVTKKVFHRK